MQTTKRVIIIHGYRSYPRDCWFPWLKKELSKKGFKVSVPKMPNPANPKMKSWVSAIKKSVKNPDKNTYLVGHSLGTIAILRYLETLKPTEKISGAISVGGKIISKPVKHQTASFFKTPIRWLKIRKRCKKFVGIYSIDDPVVSIENGRLLRKKLGAKLILEKNKGHFDRESKIFKLPSVLEEIIKMSNKNKRT